MENSLPTQDERHRGFFGHPKGLGFIVFTEAWERFSFYGMQALLVLYMTSYLFLPEHSANVSGFDGFRAVMSSVFGDLSTQALATQTFGIYIGLVYFAPVFGGFIGDRWLGRRKAVAVGALFMVAGHFMMAFEAAFLSALAALIVGSGFLKGNLAAQVGELYDPEDGRRDAGFSLYNMAINVGAFLAPLACGTLGELYGWHYGFGLAGIGMLLALFIYIYGSRHLPAERVRAGASQTVPKLQPGDGRRIAAVLTVLGITSLYWTVQTQVWNTYPLWIKGRVDRVAGDLEVPVTWFQSLDSLAVLLLAPPIIWLWQRQVKRGNAKSDLNKIAFGCGVFASACVLLSIGETLAGPDKVALVWPVMFHFVCAIGFLYIGPVAMALTSRVAPPSVNAMLISSYYLGIFFGGFGSGYLGRFYEAMSPAQFWLLHAAVVGTGAILLIILTRPLKAAMKEGAA
ncbi:peptide MFS transporter [Pacificimonas sp. WHA3]|uniref:Peptide MFS transporter n=1 Tax=Pacificimonas pallii TaxID=2827236 RepID=A0ABS6SAG9_9SPHN|nr:peptide MFS transporter [Pacificimonas pallii]MBV7255291.1 peptide MFS transporter [Pacificimonas pallii]